MTARLDCDHLGECTYDSPFQKRDGAASRVFVDDDVRVLVDVEFREGGSQRPPRSFEKAGPRHKLFFDPEKTRAAIVSCGGLCPGTNTAIRAMFLELHHLYGIREVLGYRYGFEGLTELGEPAVVLTDERVRDIHRLGGTVLGSSRGKQSAAVMIDRLKRDGVDLLFGIGGDGTLRGLSSIANEAAQRGERIGVVGIPKTIDDDIAFVDKTFGFETAVDHARAVIDAAHTEARCARNGVGIVKLMGRDAGFVAATATIASGEVNFCLLPEVGWKLERLLTALEARIRHRGHAVVVVAEGCGATLASETSERDASGNLRYASAELDIGTRLRDEIDVFLREKGIRATVKYIDPSYTIRSSPPNSADELYSESLARNAVHAGMSGRTNLLVGRKHGIHVHLPLPLVIGQKRRVGPELYRLVCESTGQTAMS